MTFRTRTGYGPARIGPAQIGPTRRQLLHGVGGALGASALSVMLDKQAGAQATAPGLDDWNDFKARFISGGRVIDTGNKGISHSEGQGWGLFAAVFFRDEATFDSLLQWTTRELRRPNDQLHAWRYMPGAANPVADQNNATDGDLFFASALARAARQWNRPELQRQAEATTRDILRLTVRRLGNRTVLLPGASGFEARDTVTLNPSYYVFPLFAELAQLVPSPLWAPLQSDGLELIANGRFGRWMLPPDWLAVSSKNETLEPAAGWPPRFSYDAIRVPLFLAWSRLGLPPIQESFTRYWSSFGSTPPAWINLADGQVAPYEAPTGMRNVAAFSSGQAAPDVRIWKVSDAQDYYSAGLTLLTNIARQENEHT